MQCFGCGRWFQPTSYKLKGKYTHADDICPKCTAGSCSQNYVNSKEWTCNATTSSFTLGIFEESGGSDG